MPRIKEELQLPSLSNITRPHDGISLYNDNGALKVLHADGTVETLAVINDQDFEFHNANYYTKSEVDNLLLSSGSGLTVKVVQELPNRPQSTDEGSLFLVPATNGYKEYLYINGSWEEVGNQDLSNYVTQSQLSNAASSVTFKDWTK